jgi:hypothetical protein
MCVSCMQLQEQKQAAMCHALRPAAGGLITPLTKCDTLHCAVKLPPVDFKACFYQRCGATVVGSFHNDSNYPGYPFGVC